MQVELLSDWIRDNEIESGNSMSAKVADSKSSSYVILMFHAREVWHKANTIGKNETSKTTFFQFTTAAGKHVDT
ncbi:hypothetical protein M0804_002114 [Polistes exclamans]|nr:hypothetical protein M0804_002114 [Polistes exclamans]